MSDRNADDPLDTPPATDDPTSTAALIGLDGMERVIEAEVDDDEEAVLARELADERNDDTPRSR